MLARDFASNGIHSKGHGFLGYVVSHHLHRHVQHVIGAHSTAIRSADLAARLGKRSGSGSGDLLRHAQVYLGEGELFGVLVKEQRSNQIKSNFILSTSVCVVDTRAREKVDLST